MQIVQREVRMKKLLYRQKDAWVGDLIPYYENGTFYGYYLHDPRIRDKEYAEETTWHLVTTKDFVNVEYKGEAIKRGGDDKPNKNAYTGSVIKDKENLYHAFFTAYNEDIKINGKSVQSVMQAVGTDLEHLNTVEEFLFVSDGKQYEEFDWRDPFVYWNEEDECYDMLLASRIKGGGELRGGCIALCKSKDLKQWTYEKPFYAPGMYITMECPEIFKMGNYWYLVFSTFSDQFTTHYRISKSPNGPWEIPEDDVFDTRSDYAIKTASDGQRRFAFGWIASKYGNKDFGPWEWGGTMVFHELIQNPEDGTLKVRVIPGVKEFYDEVQDLKPAAGYNSRIIRPGRRPYGEPRERAADHLFPRRGARVPDDDDAHGRRAARADRRAQGARLQPPFDLTEVHRLRAAAEPCRRRSGPCHRLYPVPEDDLHGLSDHVHGYFALFRACGGHLHNSRDALGLPCHAARDAREPDAPPHAEGGQARVP